MRLAMLAVLAASSSAVVGCAHEPSAPPSAQAGTSPVATVTSATTSHAPTSLGEPPAPREDGRLPALATPVHESISLDVDPAQPRFRGTATIDIDVPRPTAYVVLHAHDLHLTGVGATFGGRSIAGASTSRASHGALEPEELVLSFAEPLPAGRATLTLAWDAPFSEGLAGLYRVKEGDRWYAFTQFESTDARRAFPCFDEPAYKPTYDITLKAPKGLLAVANTPERARSDDATGTRFTFATTPPLSSYLVAFAVGDFDVREGAKGPVPIRIVTVKGKAALGDFALDATAGLVQTLGDYFALPYPFAKLDVMAVPDFAAGAMENPGLVTFREELLLLDPKHASLHDQREAAVTIAHELAHMWFGDLVTMKWWNDVWLNEGFATWMETRATDAWRPAYTVHEEAVTDTMRAMDIDALTSARAVRQPVVTDGDIEEAFDEISYQKGAAVLAMLEHTLGEATFQRGVRDYVRAHAWKNADADDLLGALDHASGRDVTGMAATFLNQPGVPVVTLHPSCAAGRQTFDLAQSSWHPLGAQAPANTSPWHIPVCVRDASGADDCADLTAAHGALATRGACGAWAYPDAGEAGYYRFEVSEKDARELAREASRLDAPSRIGLVSDLWAQVRAGDLSADAFLQILPAFDRETDGYVIKQEIDTLYAFDRALIDDASRPGFRAYVTARMAPHEKRLGWKPITGEDDGAALARPAVLQLLGEVARDPATLREADAVAKRWLADPSSVDADVASVAVSVASMTADGARWDQLRAAAKSAKTPGDRVVALRALGSFDDPKILARTFDLVLTDEVKMQDFRSVLGGRHDPGLFKREASSRALFDWLETHWEPARAKLSGGLAREWSRTLEGVCSIDGRDAETAFFTPRLSGVEGAARPLAEAAEKATSCAALRAHGAPDVARFFGTKGASRASRRGG